jgi:hypothetical protein
MSDERQALIQGLRDFADFLESNEGVPTPCGSGFDAFVQTKEELAAAARAIGNSTKEVLNQWYYLHKAFGPVRYDVNIAREKVCVKKVIGTKTVPQHTEEIVEWECSDSILGEAHAG